MTTPCLNAVTLGVTDLARSVRFYLDLGFERRFEETGDEIAFFDAGGLSLRCGIGTSLPRTHTCRMNRARRRSAA